MRSGFRNAEAAEAPGGAKSDSATRLAEALGAMKSAEDALAVRRATNESSVRGVATASANAVSQSCAGLADITCAAAVSAPESIPP